MDKQLSERLAREAGLWPLQMTEDTPAGTVAQRQAELDGWCQRFATLVAEECAKIADETLEYGAPDMGCETRAGNAAEAIRAAFQKVSA